MESSYVETELNWITSDWLLWISSEAFVREKRPQYKLRRLDSVLCGLSPSLRNKALYVLVEHVTVSI